MIVKNLGITDYLQTLAKMQEFTQQRDGATQDEIWITSHNAVFTHGISSTDKHIIKKNYIPVIKTDRGGQITYHGKGQIIIYLLLDIKRLKIGVKKLVETIEKSIIKTLQEYKISAHTITNAHGVYVNNTKIAALGLKIKNGKTYHGLSLNVNMDLTPFSYINPCGYKDLKVCNMQDFIKEKVNIKKVENTLCQTIQTFLKI